MREYATVLHLHMLELSTPLGPEYEDPGRSELMVNAERNKEKIETTIAPRVERPRAHLQP